MEVKYRLRAKFYDLIDIIYFTEKGENPRRKILEQIPNTKVRILDMCCGTLGNSIEIAKQRKSAKIIGIDLSSDMLKIAQEKIRKNDVGNAEVIVGNAIHTGFGNESFDYIILGLVLHEMDTALAKDILKEAYRLLCKDGKLIVLEWERSGCLLKRLLFLPVKVSEPEYFRTFYKSDKVKYLHENKFDIIERFYCDYSCVYVLGKGEV